MWLADEVAGAVRGRCPDCRTRLLLPVTWHEDCVGGYDADLRVWRRIFRAHVAASAVPHWSDDIGEVRPDRSG